MRRVTVTLAESELQKLARLARATGESRSALVRQAIRQAYRPEPTQDERITALLATAGAWTADRAPA